MSELLPRVVYQMCVHGGWRFMDEKGNEIDVWPGSLQEYLRDCKTKYGGAVYAVDYVHNVVYSSVVREL